MNNEDIRDHSIGSTFNMCLNFDWWLSRKEVIELADSKKPFLSEAALKVPHEGHEQHLCELRNHMAQEEYKNLIRGAQYFCQHCGRSAVSKDNLCFPEKI